MNWRITLKEQDGFGKIVEGINAVEAAISNGRVEKVIVLKTYSSTKAKNIINYCLENALTVDKVDKATGHILNATQLLGYANPLLLLVSQIFLL